MGSEMCIRDRMRRRQWVREGDLIVVQPWDFQDEKANVCMRYTKTQSLYLSRKGVLPEIVDLFGVTDLSGNQNIEIEPVSDAAPAEEDEQETEPEVIEENTSVSDEPEEDIDSFFG